MDINYQVLSPNEITTDHKSIVAKLLELQGKVNPPYENKADRCELICLASLDGKVVGMGAIKEKTNSVFELNKANVMELLPRVSYELGYLYTSPDHTNRGIGKNLVLRLIEAYPSLCLMATTEIEANPAMVRILQFQEFERIGKSWISSRHTNELGLFIRN